jgi:hypothetical protein
MLTLAGREADVVGLAPVPFAQSGPPTSRAQVEAAIDGQLAHVRDGAAGRASDVEINMVAFPVIFDDDRDGRAEKLGARTNMAPDAVLAAPHIWIGNEASMADVLIERRERWGVSSWSIPAAWIDKVAPVVARLAGT